MKMMANDNLTLEKGDKIQIFFLTTKNVVEVDADGNVYLYQQTDTEGLKKGKYLLSPQK